MPRQYYLYQHCDEWKSYSSMSFVGVFKESELKAQVILDIREKKVDVGDLALMTIRRMTPEELDTTVEYAKITPITLNTRHD